MFLEFDPDADAIYVSLLGPSDGEPEIDGAEEIDHDRRVVYDVSGRAVGVEFTSVSHGIRLDGVPQAEKIRILLASVKELAVA